MLNAKRESGSQLFRMAEANGFDREIKKGTGHASLSQRSSSLKPELWWWGVMGEFLGEFLFQKSVAEPQPRRGG